MAEAGPRFANPYADMLAEAPDGVLGCKLAVIGCGNLLLAGGYPADVTVYLIEAADFTPGGPVTPPVREGMNRVLALIRAEPAFQDAER
jgi:hypothetical protein